MNRSVTISYLNQIGASALFSGDEMTCFVLSMGTMAILPAIIWLKWQGGKDSMAPCWLEITGTLHVVVVSVLSFFTFGGWILRYQMPLTSEGETEEGLYGYLLHDCAVKEAFIRNLEVSHHSPEWLWIHFLNALALSLLCTYPRKGFQVQSRESRWWWELVAAGAYSGVLYPLSLRWIFWSLPKYTAKKDLHQDVTQYTTLLFHVIVSTAMLARAGMRLCLRKVLKKGCRSLGFHFERTTSNVPCSDNCAIHTNEPTMSTISEQKSNYVTSTIPPSLPTESYTHCSSSRPSPISTPADSISNEKSPFWTNLASSLICIGLFSLHLATSLPSSRHGCLFHQEDSSNPLIPLLRLSQIRLENIFLRSQITIFLVAFTVLLVHLIFHITKMKRRKLISHNIEARNISFRITDLLGKISGKMDNVALFCVVFGMVLSPGHLHTNFGLLALWAILGFVTYTPMALLLLLWTNTEMLASSFVHFAAACWGSLATNVSFSLWFGQGPTSSAYLTQWCIISLPPIFFTIIMEGLLELLNF